MFPNSSPIDIGSLGAAIPHASRNELKFVTNFAQLTSRRFQPSTSIAKINASQFPWTKSTTRSQLERNVRHMADYYRANHFDAFIPHSILESHLQEGCLNITDEHQYNLLAGQCLAILDNPESHGDLLAFPTGQNMSQLALGELEVTENHVTGVRTASTLDFKTPILQLTCNQHDAVMAVRSYEGMGFVRYSVDTNGSLERMFLTRTSAELLDFTFNPVIQSNAAAIDRYGSIYLWDGTNQLSLWSNNAQHEQDCGLDNQRWRGCRFGLHPRTLLVAHSKHIELTDLRVSPTSTPQRLFEIDSSDEYLTGFDIPQTSSHHVILASVSRTILLDTRYPKTPLLHWSLNHPNERQTFIQHTKNSILADSIGSTTFYTWGRQTGEVMLYSYDETDSYPPTCSFIQKLPSFATHPQICNQPFDVHPFSYINPIVATRSRCLASEESTHWPCLSGCVFLKSEDVLSLLHLSQDGALYSQSFAQPQRNAPLKASSAVERLLSDCESRMRMMEAENTKKQNMYASMVASHDVLDMSGFIDFSNGWLNKEIEAKEQDEAIVDEDAGTTFRFDDTGLKPLIDACGAQKKLEFEYDNGKANLPRLFAPSSIHAPGVLNSIIERHKSLHPETQVMSIGVPFIKSREWVSKSEIEAMIAAEMNLTDTGNGRNALNLDNECGVAWLTEDLWASQFVVRHGSTQFQVDTTKISDQTIISKSETGEGHTIETDNDADSMRLDAGMSTPRIRNSSVADDSGRSSGNDSDTSGTSTSSLPKREHPLDGLPMVMKTPLLSAPQQITGAASTCHEIWEYPEHFYRVMDASQPITLTPRLRSRNTNRRPSSLTPSRSTILAIPTVTQAIRSADKPTNQDTEFSSQTPSFSQVSTSSNRMRDSFPLSGAKSTPSNSQRATKRKKGF